MGSILFIQTARPQGGIGGKEGLDAVLMGSAFTDCALLFTGDGVLQLLRHQQPGSMGSKNFTLAYGALKDYGISNVFCCQASLQERGLESAQLMIDVALLSGDEIHALITSYDKTLCF